MASANPGAQGMQSAKPANKWGVLVSVVFGLFMVILDSTVVNVAFPTLRREFGASVNDAQWIISIYVMALGISTPLAGFLADRFGIKRMYLLGLILFVIGSLLCGVVPSSTMDLGFAHVNGLVFLIAARALEGFGGGISLPLGTALLLSSFSAAEQGMALGIFGIALVLAPALGPILGGWLVDNNLWRWIFFINLPIGTLGVILASILLRERRSERRVSLDILGFVTSAVGFGAVLYAASIASIDDWSSQQVLVSFAIGGVALLAFALVELFVAREPLLDLRLFGKPVFLIASLIGYVGVTALFGAEFLMPLYLQTLRGKTAFETGLLLLPLAIAAGITAPFAGRLYDRVGPRILIVVGFSLLALNTWQFSQLTGTTDIPFIMALLAVRGFAVGLTVQTTLVAALSVVPQRQLARGSALANATRQVVQSIAVAVLATVLTASLSAQVLAAEQQYQGSPAAQNVALCDPATYPQLPPGAPNLTPLLQEACSQSVQGYDNAYTLTFYFALAALALGLLLPGWPLKWAGRQSPPAEAAQAAAEESPAGFGAV